MSEVPLYTGIKKGDAVGVPATATSRGLPVGVPHVWMADYS
jgi:hypothetical protein